MDFSNFLEKGVKLANKTAQGAKTLVNMGKEKASEITLESKLSVLQRKLGELIYTMAKSGNSNSTLVQKYIDQIDTVQAQLADIKGGANLEKFNCDEFNVCEKCGAILKDDEFVCPICSENEE